MEEKSKQAPSASQLMLLQYLFAGRIDRRQAARRQNNHFGWNTSGNLLVRMIVAHQLAVAQLDRGQVHFPVNIKYHIGIIGAGTYMARLDAGKVMGPETEKTCYVFKIAYFCRMNGAVRL